jgi:hypothetical protein
LQFVLDQHRSPKIWQKDIKTWEWKLLDSISNYKFDSNEEVSLTKSGNCHFIQTPNKRPSYIDDKYILIGKGIYKQ